MKWTLRVTTSVVLALLLRAVISAPIDDDIGTFNKALDGIDKVLAFLADDYSQVNLDGVYGLRIGQGQLEAAVNELYSHGKSYALTERVKAMDALAQTIAEEARSYLEAEDQSYYNRFVSFVDAPYLIRYTPVALMFQKDNNTFNELKEGDHYNEDEGDACLARLMGTFIDENEQLVPRCTITQACWDVMTEPGGYRYKITHQILYFIVGHKQNCDRALEQYLRGERVHEIETRMCQSVYAEANSFAENGTIGIFSQDLFMEQITLCGILGYEDFLKNNWILMVLQWQQADGCFTIPGLQEALPAILNALNATTTTTTTTSRPQRSLLRDSFMKDGCKSHMTGLGLSTLCTYVHYMSRRLPYMPGAQIQGHM